MKTATKVFLIIGIVMGSLIVLYGIMFFFIFSVFFRSLWYDFQNADVYAVMSIFTVMGIIMILSGAAVIVVSAVALAKLNRARRASDISTGLKVCVLIFGNLVAGILLLCMKDADYLDAPSYNQPPPPYGYNYYYPPNNGQPPYSGQYQSYGTPPPPYGYNYPPQGNGQPPYNGQYPPPPADGNGPQSGQTGESEK